MTKVVGPEDLEILTKASERMREADAEAHRCRDQFLDQRTDENKAAWVKALKEQQKAWDDYWSTHQEYFIEL